jgi:hypothetical protein
MIPFIKDDSALILRPIDPQRGIRLGDIVAVPNRKKTRIIVHRVIRVKKAFCQTKGDNCLAPDRWCPIDDIVGVVDAIDNTGWIPYRCRPWQNVIIAIASKTGVLNRLIYPGFIHLRNLMRLK